MAPVLVTGVAGFIGYHLAARLLDEGRSVVGIDNMSDYYDVNLKRARLESLRGRNGFSFEQVDIADNEALQALFGAHGFELVFNMAAQPGVRYSLINPHAYVKSNIEGFVNLLEACRHHSVKHLVFASSSSVY